MLLVFLSNNKQIQLQTRDYFVGSIQSSTPGDSILLKKEEGINDISISGHNDSTTSTQRTVFGHSLQCV